MKPPRTWIPVLALLVLALFGTPVAYASPYCGYICSCAVPCRTLFHKGLASRPCPVVRWTYEICAEKPACFGAPFASSAAMTSNTSSGKANLVLESIFAPVTSMTR